MMAHRWVLAIVIRKVRNETRSIPRSCEIVKVRPDPASLLSQFFQTPSRTETFDMMID